MRHERKTASRTTVRRYVEADDVIVVLDVPVVFAPESPDEPLLEARTLKLLDEAQRRARLGDYRWLRRHGTIYRSVPA